MIDFNRESEEHIHNAKVITNKTFWQVFRLKPLVVDYLGNHSALICSPVGLCGGFHARYIPPQMIAIITCCIRSAIYSITFVVINKSHHPRTFEEQWPLLFISAKLSGDAILFNNYLPEHLLVTETWDTFFYVIPLHGGKTCIYLPAKFPVLAASNVDTWKRRRASSTWFSFAKGFNSIFARDSDIRIMASSCLWKERKLQS